MNEKFYNLPEERQHQIINGALKIFSESSYAQTSTLAIAQEAGISKGLLFHYFKNKKELYLFLYEYCITNLLQEMEENKNHEEHDFFEIILQSQNLKCKMMKKYRYIYAYILRVYLEVDEEITSEIATFSKPFVEENFRNFFERIDAKKFREGVDIPLLFKSLQWCADGFMREALNQNKKMDAIATEFEMVLKLYRQNFYKEEFVCITTNMETEKIKQ